MPSIPQSLLWISLVVLWLFVLVPMLINKRDTVRRTSDVALATRVLNGGAKSRLIKKRGPAAGHRHDPNWQAPVWSAEAEDFPDHFDESEEFAEQQEVIRVYDDAVREARMGGRVRSVVVVAAMAETTVTETDYLDVDVVEDDSGALPVGGTGVQAGPVDEPAQAPAESEPVAELVAEAESERVAGPEAVVDAEDVVEPEAVTEPEAAFTPAPEPEMPAEPVQPPKRAERERISEPRTRRPGEYEYIDDTSGLEEESRIAAPAFSASRQRRMENTTAAAVEARKYRFRKRVLTVLAALLVVSAGLSVFVDSALWWVCGALGGVTILYLGYLRRQTRIEAQVRRRRQQRQARVRPFADAYRQGEEAAPPRRPEVDYDEFPTRLQRPGAVVLEIDDEDPVFEYLDEMAYSGRGYRPTPGPTDLRRASGL